MELVKRFSLWLFLLAGCSSSNKQTPVIAIQPIGKVIDDKIEIVKQALDSIYHVRIIVLPLIASPKEAFVNIKTPRYRADKLIAWLKENKPDTVDYIMGLTGNDISVTKTDGMGRVKEPKSLYEDFGIFGLGYEPGFSCVVSYFRLGSEPLKLKDRLMKICVHELGHNFGLPHCENKSCVMADAVEKISTVDNEGMELCEKCRKIIGR